jgi:class 3 adenylate cyclase
MRMGAAATRKTVTVLFCDLVGSTSLGEQLDAEALREVLGRWHEAMRTPVEEHGGTVEKFIGDAVMAVFGVPRVHEDDALRAVQAGVRMRDALKRLNDELAAEGRPVLGIRVGITSGEVVAGAGAATLVTGDAVNTAKRLEEAARANEILIGDPTRLLVENAVLLEPADPVDAKGKAQPVVAWRVLGTVAGADSFARRLDAPLIGRGDELAFLERELDVVTRERTCRLVTVYADAGVGKSRLAAELAARVRARVHVATARCVPYGDGITFLPLRELLHSLGGAGAVRRAIAGEPDAALIEERLGATAAAEDTMWAVRRLLETLARERPLLVCVEDAHWAQPTFLDLLEYALAWTHDAPVLLLCLARPDLLDARPRWPGAALALRPLNEREAAALLDALEDEWPLTSELRVRIADAAEGNPLFVEQMVAMLSETDGTALTVPPTIHALLAARLDRLEPLERAVLERAAVAGREFSRAALAELSPADERPLLGPTLLSLVRKELLRPSRGREPGEDALRFGHTLIRDAAYAEIPKAARAQLHEQFAAWLESADAEKELVGYHLEQAYRCAADLGSGDDRLRERAAELLAEAGRRAHARDDMPAAVNLLERALGLADLGAGRAELLRELASAQWRLGAPRAAAEALGAAIERARGVGDVRLEWLCRLEDAARRRMLRGGDHDLVSVANQAIEVFSELGDDAGLARAWRRLALASISEWRFADGAIQAERALQHARRAGDHSEDVALTDTYCTALLFGPEPAPTAAAWCRELLGTYGADRMTRAVIVSSIGGLEAMQGSFDTARGLAREAAGLFDEVGARLTRAGLAEIAAEIERLAGDLEAAERELRLGREIFTLAGSPALAGLNAAALVRILVEQERLDEAEQMLAEARASLREDDIDGYVTARLAAGTLAAARRRSDEARRLADEALEALSGTDAVWMRAEVLAVRAAAAGEPPGEAVAVHELKGNIAAAARLRELSNARVAR